MAFIQARDCPDCYEDLPALRTQGDRLTPHTMLLPQRSAATECVKAAGVAAV